MMTLEDRQTILQVWMQQANGNGRLNIISKDAII
jgi:hypothetical protein